MCAHGYIAQQQSCNHSLQITQVLDGQHAMLCVQYCSVAHEVHEQSARDKEHSGGASRWQKTRDNVGNVQGR